MHTNPRHDSFDSVLIHSISLLIQGSLDHSQEKENPYSVIHSLETNHE